MGLSGTRGDIITKCAKVCRTERLRFSRMFLIVAERPAGASALPTTGRTQRINWRRSPKLAASTSATISSIAMMTLAACCIWNSER